ncbi:NAD-dependent epimerase/dehydratase family protein [Candidatus Bathyarchaeota archaeon]|nr:NAD-dependent epimerase/dehydratase family protein [Candidatus Bathyarchaeota archaeon]
MVVLVTGGSGFIGRHIVDRLIEDAYEVRVLDIKKPHRDEVEWIKVDLMNKEDLIGACRDAEYVFHLAAISDVNVALSKPELCVGVNEVGTLNVLQAAQALEVERVILASTTWVYGRTEGVATEEMIIPPPDHLYTATKIAQEHLVLSWSKHYGLPYTILRYDIPYGPGMRLNMAIARFVWKAMRGQPVTVYGDGSQGRCFIYIEDLAVGNVAALSHSAENATVNLAGKEFVSLTDVVEELKNIFPHIQVRYDRERQADFRGVRVGIQKAAKLLGWEPKIAFREGLRKYVEYTRDRR